MRRLWALMIGLGAWSGCVFAQGQANAPARTPIMAPPNAADVELERALNAGPRGSLAVRAVQGTKGGPDVGQADVEVELFHRNQKVHLLRGRLDDRGMLIIKDVPLGLAVRPVVRVKHANATYQDTGPQMDAKNPTASVEVTVYEVTDQQPKWRVTQRTLAIAVLAGVLDIVETLEVENPGDRTWMGAPPDAEGRRATVHVPLAQGSRDVELLNGFHGWCCTSKRGDELVVQMPLMPGRTPFRYTYRVDVPSGSADVKVAMPVACGVLGFLIPDDATGVLPLGVETAGTRMVGDTRVRAFQVNDLEPGVSAGLHISGVLAAQVPVATASSTAPVQHRSWWSGGSAPVVIALGVGGLIVGGALLLYLRPPAGKGRARSAGSK